MKALKLHALKKHREERQWTQDMLSEFSGVSVRTIQRLESGSAASMDTAKALAATLGPQSVADLQEITGDTPSKTVDSAPAAEADPGPVAAMDPSHPQNHDDVSIMRKQHTFAGGVLFILLIIAVLSNPEGRKAVYWIIGSGLVAAMVGGLLTLRLPRKLALSFVTAFAWIGVIISITWQGSLFFYHGFQEIQLKAFVAQVGDAHFRAQSSMNMWIDKQSKSGKDSSHYGELQVTNFLEKGLWDGLVSKMNDYTFPASCPHLRVDMTTDELSHWLDDVDNVCVQHSSRVPVRMYGRIY